MKCPKCESVNPLDSKYCPKCGVELASFDAQDLSTHRVTPAERTDTDAVNVGLPVRLEIEPGASLKPNNQGVIDCRLTSVADKPVHVDVSMQSGGLELLPPGQVHPEYLPGRGQTAICAFTFNVPRSGRFPVSIQLRFDDGLELEGRLVLQTVDGEAPSSVTIIGRTGSDEQRIRVGDEHIHINAGVGTDQQSPLSTHIFYEVPLKTASGRKRLAGHSRPSPEHQTSRLSLLVHDNAGAVRNVCLFAQATTTLGKQRDTDLRLRLTRQRDPEGRLWQSISRRHATIEFDDQGPRWINAESDQHNGTLANGQWYESGQDFLLLSGMSVSPADVLELNVKTLNAGDYTSADYSRFVESILSARVSRVSGVCGVRLRRNDDLVDREEYVIFRDVCSIGSASDCGVVVPDETVRPFHARLLHLGGWFWVESKSAAASVLVDDVSLVPDHLALLTPNTELQIGSVTITVHAFKQHILDGL